MTDPQKAPFLDIVFEGGPFPEPMNLVEVEDENRRSIEVGTMLQRDDGRWVLRLPWVTNKEAGSRAAERR